MKLAARRRRRCHSLRFSGITPLYVLSTDSLSLSFSVRCVLLFEGFRILGDPVVCIFRSGECRWRFARWYLITQFARIPSVVVWEGWGMK